MSDLAPVFSLEHGEIALHRGPAVFHTRFESGVLICLRSQSEGAGGAVLVQSQEGAKASLLELIDAFRSAFGDAQDLEAKIIIPREPSDRAAWGLPLEKISFVVRSMDKGPVEAYYYTPEGRLRLSVTRKSKTRVLVIDDSKTICRLLESLFASDPTLEVVGSVQDPAQAMGQIEALKPDVITLDIHMPGMNGVELLKRYLPMHPIPTVMISALSLQDGDYVLSALQEGAVDYIQKPSFEDLPSVGPEIIEKVRSAARIVPKLRNRSQPVRARVAVGPVDTSMIVAMGASTGGTEALAEVLQRLPQEIPPIVIVQHIPPVFSKAFATRLNDLCPFEVKEAEDGDALQPGRVLIAPGGYHMRVFRGTGENLLVRLDQSPKVNRHRPAVDVLFDSVARVVKKRAIGLILTGMGADGAKGLLSMRQAGAHTIAQDEKSCVVFGMPREAIQIGAAVEVLPLDRIADVLLSRLSQRKAQVEARFEKVGGLS